MRSKSSSVGIAAVIGNVASSIVHGGRNNSVDVPNASSDASAGTASTSMAEVSIPHEMVSIARVLSLPIPCPLESQIFEAALRYQLVALRVSIGLRDAGRIPPYEIPLDLPSAVDAWQEATTIEDFVDHLASLGRRSGLKGFDSDVCRLTEALRVLASCHGELLTELPRSAAEIVPSSDMTVELAYNGRLGRTRTSNDIAQGYQASQAVDLSSAPENDAEGDTPAEIILPDPEFHRLSETMRAIAAQVEQAATRLKLMQIGYVAREQLRMTEQQADSALLGLKDLRKRLADRILDVMDGLYFELEQSRQGAGRSMTRLDAPSATTEDTTSGSSSSATALTSSTQYSYIRLETIFNILQVILREECDFEVIPVEEGDAFDSNVMRRSSVFVSDDERYNRVAKVEKIGIRRCSDPARIYRKAMVVLYGRSPA